MSYYHDVAELDNPTSPFWRAKDFRRRPHLPRRVALAAISLTFFASLLYFFQSPHNDPVTWAVVEDMEAPVQVHVPVVHPQYNPPEAAPPDIPYIDTHDDSRTHIDLTDNFDKSPDASAVNPDARPESTSSSSDVADPPGPEPIVFSLIMWSDDSASEGAMLMKSILMYASRPVEFHIICDNGAEKFLRYRLSLVERPAHPLLVRFYRPTWEQMTARIEREGAITTDHSAGVPGLMKLFIHEILPPSVTRAIFVDTDALFISDAAALWDVFDTLGPAAALAVPTHPDQSAPEWHHANRICSCVMLLDLARLRAVRLMDSAYFRAASPSPASPEPDYTDPALLAAAFLPGAPAPQRALAPRAFRAMFGAPAPATGHYAGVKLGDQGYWWALVDFYRGLAAHLPFDWEVSSCLMDMYRTGLGADAAREAAQAGAMLHTHDTPHAGEAVVPRMLHFNCLDGPPRFFEWEGWADQTNSLAQRWGPAVQYHVGFKWFWLNRRRGMPAGNVTLETVDNVQFADERFALEHGIALSP